MVSAAEQARFVMGTDVMGLLSGLCYLRVFWLLPNGGERAFQLEAIYPDLTAINWNFPKSHFANSLNNAPFQLAKFRLKVLEYMCVHQI